MEVDLINVYVEKQRDAINDLMARVIMLEARLVVSEKQAQKSGELTDKLSDTEGKIKILQEQNSVMNAVIEKQKQEIETIALEKNELKKTEELLNQERKKAEELKSIVNKLTLEKESQRVKAEKLRKKAQEMISEEKNS